MNWKKNSTFYTLDFQNILVLSKRHVWWWKGIIQDTYLLTQGDNLKTILYFMSDLVTIVQFIPYFNLIIAFFALFFAYNGFSIYSWILLGFVFTLQFDPQITFLIFINVCRNFTFHEILQNFRWIVCRFPSELYRTQKRK